MKEINVSHVLIKARQAKFICIAHFIYKGNSKKAWEQKWTIHPPWKWKIITMSERISFSSIQWSRCRLFQISFYYPFGRSTLDTVYFNVSCLCFRPFIWLLAGCEGSGCWNCPMVLTVMQQWQKFSAYRLTFCPPAHRPDSKGYTCGAGKVCCRADQQTGGRTEGERGSRETGGATEESTIGMFTLYSEPVSAL